MRGMQTYLKVRKMAKNGLNTEEISKKTGIPKRTVERYLRHKTGRQPTIPIGTHIRLPDPFYEQKQKKLKNVYQCVKCDRESEHFLRRCPRCGSTVVLRTKVENEEVRRRCLKK